jgi:hypothetical protein
VKLRKIAEILVSALAYLVVGAIFVVTPPGQIAIVLAALTSPIWISYFLIRGLWKLCHREKPQPAYTYPPMIKNPDAEAQRVYRLAMDAELQRVKAETMDWLNQGCP